jgi:hypothetical protein
MTTAPLDSVTVFLKSQGIEPTVAYFESSGFVIGWRIRTGGFELVYRVEGDQLIVCDFEAIDSEGNPNGAVAAFIRFVHRIERQVPQLALVRGMFIEPLSNPTLCSHRRRLAHVLQSQGAAWRVIDGDPWLVYPISADKNAASTKPVRV